MYRLQTHVILASLSLFLWKIRLIQTVMIQESQRGMKMSFMTEGFSPLSALYQVAFKELQMYDILHEKHRWRRL